MQSKQAEQARQSEMRIFYFRYIESEIPINISLDQKIRKVIEIAKNEFGCSNDRQYSLMYRSQEFNEEDILSGDNLKEFTVLDLICKAAPRKNLVLQILNKPLKYTWNSSPSKQIGEAMQDFCHAHNLDLSSFNTLIRDKPLDRSLIIGNIREIQNVIIEFIAKAENVNYRNESQTNIEENKGDSYYINPIESYDIASSLLEKPGKHLLSENLSVSDSSRNKMKSSETKLFTLKYENKSFLRQFSLDTEISFVKKVMIDSLKLLADTPLIFKYQEHIMEPQKELHRYITEPIEPMIEIEILKDKKELSQIMVLFGREELKLLVKKDFLIKEIRNLACSRLNIKPFYLYSLYLDNERLQPSVQKVSDFGEWSVFELSSKKEILLIDETSQDLGEIIFDLTLDVKELKKQILLQKSIAFQDMTLKLSNTYLEDQNPLSDYIGHEDPVIIMIEKKEKKTGMGSSLLKNNDGLNKDFLIDSKREYILNSDPFQILYGDSQQLSNELYKNVFKGMMNRVVVISVLGLRSSEKSTLLNSLFGCNISESSRGILGSFLKRPNLDSDDGILLLDMEGFSLDKGQQRYHFDKKLVLFCLAMSDFVFINFKGDLDQTFTEALIEGKDFLERLQEGKDNLPEIYFLNQNTEPNNDTQPQSIQRMIDVGFSKEKVEVLPYAFEVSLNESQKSEKFMDSVLKKTPTKNLSEKFCLIEEKIFDKIKQSVICQKQNTLENIFERMEYFWEFLNTFPHLFEAKRSKDNISEKEIVQVMPEDK